MNFLRFMHGKPMGGGPLPKAAPLLLLCLFLVLNVHAEAQAALRRSAVVNAVEKASPAVVNISTVSKERVVRNSAAGRVGLKPGDLIYKVNDMPIKNLDDFREAISRYHHQNALNLIVRRGGYVYSLKLPF